MDEWPNVVGGQVGISAFAWMAGHLSFSLHPASTYPASRTFKGQVGLKVGRSGSQVQGMLQDLARRALRVRCKTRQVDTQSLLPRLVSLVLRRGTSLPLPHTPPPTGHQPPQTHGPTGSGLATMGQLGISRLAVLGLLRHPSIPWRLLGAIHLHGSSLRRWQWQSLLGWLLC